MSSPTTKTGHASRFGEFAPWIAIAIVATLAGLFLPQLLPGESAVGKLASKSETKSVGSLDYSAPAIPEPPNFRAMMLRLSAGTVLVLGICVGTLWGARRWMNPTAATGSDARAMRLLETLQLGNRCCLHLVHLGDREMIVGVDGSGIKSVLPLAESFADVFVRTDKAPTSAGSVPSPRLRTWAGEAEHES